jgi:uncharacterized protein (TIGR02646 family)
MRAITKQAEPSSLAQYRAGVDTAYAKAYDEFPDKGTVRGQLVNEQRGLCAFCGGRIFNDPLKMKIAHWTPRKLKVIDANGAESFPNLPDQLSYWNMLGCCNGNEGQPPEKQHCDTHQGNMPLSKNPANPAHRIEDIVSFLNDGSIVSSDATFNSELGCKKADGTFDEGALNLNLSFLRTNRKDALDGFFRDGLPKRARLTKDQITKLLSLWRGDQPGELKPYAPVIAYWLKKRLAREA